MQQSRQDAFGGDMIGRIAPQHSGQMGQSHAGIAGTKRLFRALELQNRDAFFQAAIDPGKLRVRLGGQFPLPGFRATAQLNAPCGDGCRSRQGDQQQSHGTRQSSDGRLAPTPAPGLFKAADGPSDDWLVTQKATQLFGQGSSSGVTARWLFLQALQANRFQISRHGRIQSARRQRIVVQRLLHGLGHAAGCKRGAPGDQMIEQRAQRINVA